MKATSVQEGTGQGRQGAAVAAVTLSPCHPVTLSSSEEELGFYEAYGWCLNPYPTVGESVGRLGGELGRLTRVGEGWQTAEVMTNVYLLSCAVLNAVDEYLRGSNLQLPRRAPALP